MLTKEKTEVREVQELRLLQQISRILDQHPDINQVIGPVLDALAQHMDLQHGTVTLLNRKTGDITIDLAQGMSKSQVRRGRYKLGEGVTGRVVETGKPAVIPRISESSRFLDRTRRGKERDVSFICVPVQEGQETFGALSVDRLYRPEVDLDEDLKLLTIVASMIANTVRVRRQAEEERDRLNEENERLRAELRERFQPANIIGKSHEMRDVYDQIYTVSKSPTSVLIQGETGTGKELVAQAIHYNSQRASRPFVKVHCAALPESLVESELFGHVRGAFTGAVSDRKGRFELAHGGTLFLDEVGDIPTTIQIKLLRVLQEREFERVGDTKTVKIDVRLIAATNQDLTELVQKGKFRKDLFYRLHVFPIYVPPLRKRKTDIALLADAFLEKHAKTSGRPVRRLSSAVIDMLLTYHWPGNVRELESCIERAILLATDDVIHPHHMPPTLQTAEASGTVNSGTLTEMVDAFERDIVQDALKSCRGNVAAAARSLGSTARILGYKVRKLRIDPKRYS